MENRLKSIEKIQKSLGPLSAAKQLLQRERQENESALSEIHELSKVVESLGTQVKNLLEISANTLQSSVTTPLKTKIVSLGNKSCNCLFDIIYSRPQFLVVIKTVSERDEKTGDSELEFEVC